MAETSGPFKSGRTVRLVSISVRFNIWTAMALVLSEILGAFLLAAAQQHTSECVAVRPQLAIAQKALAAGDTSTALATLERAVEPGRRCAETFLLLGLTEFQMGYSKKSIERYKQALEIQPRSYSGHYDLALSYLKENDLVDARKELEQAVSLDPKQPNAAYDLGVVLLQLHEPAGALPYLLHAQALNPNRADVVFNIVLAELESGNPIQARQAAQDGAKHLGSDFQWNVSIGQLFLQHAQPLDAALYLGTANRMRPADEDLRDQLASAYVDGNQPTNALDVIKDPTSAEDHYLRGSAFYELRRFEDADTESDAALSFAPNDPRVLVLRVRLFQRAGQQNAALEMAQKAIGLAPQWDQPFYLAGISYYFLRHYTAARQSLTRAMELNPNSARAAFVAALAWAGEGKYPEAEQTMRRAITLDPDNARFQCHLGILLTRENRNAEAGEFFEKAIQIRPGYALSHYELGKLQAQARDWQKAARELEKTIALDPGLIAAYYQLGHVEARLGNREKSEQMLAEFQKLHSKEVDESEAVDRDAQAESN
jgi:protein O-GlcNAc transferase